MNAHQRRKHRRRPYTYGTLRLHFYGEGSYQLGTPAHNNRANELPKACFVPDPSRQTKNSGSWYLGSFE